MAKKILIIEDEKVLANLLQKRLISEGYSVAVSYDGKDGLKKLKELSPDLLLLDILLPRLDGFGIMKEMKKDKDLKKIPIVIVSNSGQPVEIDKAKKLGAKDWLIKAEFDPQEVIDKVIRQIGK